VRKADVIEVLDALDSAGVEWWVLGGWGVDALIGEQTRAHKDLDLAVFLTDLPVSSSGGSRDFGGEETMNIRGS
jgi:hypothetical protein